MLYGKRQGKTLYIRLEGEIDDNEAQSMRRDVDKLLEDMTLKHVILDMSRVSFMDSAGIGFILGRYKLLAARGGSLTLRDPQPQVDRILKLSGVYQLIHRMDGDNNVVQGGRS